VPAPSPDHELVTAFAVARAMCRREATDASLPTFFLPRRKRDGVYAVWAFARLIRVATRVDDAGGECCSGAGGVAPLLKSRVDAMYDPADTLQLPLPQFRDESQWVMLAAADAVRRFDVPRRLWHELVDGLIAFGAVERVATWRSLDAYLAATGGVAARIIAAVLGATHSDAGEFAAAVGKAVGLTQILRSLKRDAGRNRVLLPIEDLARCRYSERDLLAGTMNEHVSTLVRDEVMRARRLLDDGAAGTCWLAEDGSRMAVGAFVALQHRALDAIGREPASLFREHGPRPASLASQLRALPLAWRIAKRRPGAAEYVTPTPH
jgi:phytoene synthase